MHKLSVDQALLKAKSHIKKNEITEAKKLYQAVLLAFPKNMRIQKELATLNKYQQTNVIESLPKETIANLVNLYNQGQYEAVFEQSQLLTNQYPQVFSIWNILGAANKELGQVEEASKAFKKVTELNPNYADGFNNLGITLQILRKYDEAVKAYKKGISIKPNYAEGFINLGTTLSELGKTDEAIEAYRKALSIKPDYSEAHYNMGNALKVQGKLNEAIESYDKALSIKPNYADAYNNKGSALKDQGKLDEAIEVYEKVLSLNPENSNCYSNIGVAYQEQGNLDKALEALQKSILLKPNYPEAYYNIGNILKDLGKLDDAIEAFKKSLSLNPKNADGFINIGVALREQFKFDEAIEAYNEALLLKPDYAEAYHNKALVLTVKGKLDEAKKAYNKAILLKPDFADAQVDLSFIHLNNGELKDGLNQYEWRWKTKKGLTGVRHFTQPLWDGKESLKDKSILVWCEQGIGDIINWSSRLSYVSSQSQHCILECQEKLVPLLQRSFPNVEVKQENRSLDLERDDFDCHLPMGSLYKHFIEDISQNPKIETHLIPNSERVKFWKERLQSLGNGPYIGISWKSSDMSPARILNYSSIDEWSPILTIPDVNFINLQSKDFEDDLIKIQNKLGVKVHNFDDLDQFDDIDDVTSLCSALDIVVSNKTAVPFMSGGVGTTTKLANWRQSSWNNILLNPISSSVEIYERNSWEPWDKVFNLIADDILKSIKNRSS